MQSNYEVKKLIVDYIETLPKDMKNEDFIHATILSLLASNRNINPSQSFDIYNELLDAFNID